LLTLLDKDFRTLDITEPNEQDQVWVKLSEKEEREIKKFAVSQNITILRNRVNELGVSEPVIQQQGENRIMVQLPGVQDTTHAKEILGTTATLEYRMVDVEHDVQQAASGHVPIGSRLYRDKNGNPILLDKRVIVTGDQIVDASSGVDQDGRPSVNISLDGVGAAKMAKTTQVSVGKPMAVVFIEYKVDTKTVNGVGIRSPAFIYFMNRIIKRCSGVSIIVAFINLHKSICYRESICFEFSNDGVGKNNIEAHKSAGNVIPFLTKQK